MKNNTEFQDNITASYDQYDFTLKALFVFNPTAIPTNPKPSEQDIQDTKLLYYHPVGTNLDEKRNQVGMAEGVFVFCDSFDSQSNENIIYPRYQTIHLVEQTHIVAQINKELYIFFSFSHMAFTSTSTQDSYYTPECHSMIFGTNQELYVSVCQNFLQSFQLWCGAYDKLPLLLSSFIPTWIHCHSKPTSLSLQQLNFLNFQHQQFKYAPIDGQLFLTLQYLISMLHQIDTNLTEITIFYQGYFIYSSLNHKTAIYLKDHYYGSGLPWIISENKLQNKFKLHEYNEQDTAFMHFCNLKNFTRWDLKPQKIFLLNNEEHNYFTFMDKNFLVLMAFKTADQNFLKLKDFQICIQKNCDKITQRLDQFIEQNNSKSDALRFIYYNGMNLAFKVSNSIQIQKMTPENINLIWQISEKLQKNSFRQEIVRIGGSWFCGIKLLSRSLIVILPTTVSMSKLEEELNKALDSSFSSLFL